jgi:hypothetical protein
MGRLAQTEGLTDVQRQIIEAVREFVDREVIPRQQLEHADEYPQKIVDGMCEMGLSGLTIPEEYGGLGESLLTYALAVEEISRGWMSVSGIINTHFVEAGIPGATVATVAEAFAHQQVAARSMLLVLPDDLHAQGVRVACRPIQFSTAPTVPVRGAPLPGTDTASVAAEFGLPRK